MPEDLDLAAVNSPQLCVVSGEDAAIDRFMRGSMRRRSCTASSPPRMPSTAAWSSRRWRRLPRSFAPSAFAEPSIPYVSTLTGSWIDRWPKSRSPSTGPGSSVTPSASPTQCARLLQTPERIMLEVGPAETLVPLIRQTAKAGAGAPASLSSLGSARATDPKTARCSARSAVSGRWAPIPTGRLSTQATAARRVAAAHLSVRTPRHWVDAPAAS